MPSILSLSIALIVSLSLVPLGACRLNGFHGTNVPNSWNFGVGAEDALPAVSESDKRSPKPPLSSTHSPAPSLKTPFSNAPSLKTPSSVAAVFSLQGVEEAWEIYPYLQEGSRYTKRQGNIGILHKMQALVSTFSTKYGVQSGQDGGDGMAGSPGNAPISDHSSTTVDLFRGRKLLCRESTKSHKWTSKHKPSSCTHPRVVSPSVFSPPVGATGLNLSPSVSAQPHELSITINNVTYVTCAYVCIGTFAGVGSLIGIVWKIIKYIMAMQSTQPQPDDAGAHAGAGAGAKLVPPVPIIITIDRRTA